MSIFRLALTNLRFRKQNALVSILLMAFGIGLVSLVLTVKDTLENKAGNSAKGIDLVIGAKGSPLQLVLANVFHIDNPTGNISLKQVQPFLRNPLIQQTALLSYGDYYKNTRILGTSLSFFQFYPVRIKEGRLPQKAMEVAISSQTASALQLKPGDRFTGNHGDSEGDTHHNSFVVTGILQLNGTVTDKLIITPLESVWEVHHHMPGTDPEVTAALVRFRNPMGMMTIPGIINKKTTLMAALPAIEINRLLSLFESAFNALIYLAFAIVVIALLSVFLSLINSLEQRKYELALIRLQGGTRTQVFGLICFEAQLTALAGSVVGLLMSKIALFLILPILNPAMNADFTNLLPEEVALIPAAIIIGTIAAIVPAIKACRVNINELLSER